MKSTNKTLIALAISMAAIGASAQVDKAASNAADAAQHKVDQKRAEAKAADSGPIGKAVNNTKAEYHEKMAEKDTKDAKKALGVDNSKTCFDQIVSFFGIVLKFLKGIVFWHNMVVPIIA